jgi:hypothetical protein
MFFYHVNYVLAREITLLIKRLNTKHYTIHPVNKNLWTNRHYLMKCDYWMLRKSKWGRFGLFLSGRGHLLYNGEADKCSLIKVNF